MEERTGSGLVLMEPTGPVTQRPQLSDSSDLDKKAQEGTGRVGLLTPLKIEQGFRVTVN